MTAIDLASSSPSLEAILELAGQENVILKTPDGRAFVLAEIDDFAQEVANVQQNKELMKLLEDRSKEKPKYTSSDIRKKLKLK